jgi:hypothetical protein
MNQMTNSFSLHIVSSSKLLVVDTPVLFHQMFGYILCNLF